MAWRVRIWLVAGVCSLLAVSVVTAGCGSGGSSGGAGSRGGSGEVSKSDLAKYESELQEAFEGTYAKPEGKPIKPPGGKDIWVIQVTAAVESVEQSSDAMKEAASKLGWKVNFFDGRFEPNRWLTGVEQAITAKADGIVLLLGVGCPEVKAGLIKAKEAGIPVVGVEAKDCEPSLLSEFEYSNGKNAKEHNENGFGAYQGVWVVAKTKGEAKVITTVETDIENTKDIARGAKAKIEECPTCEIVEEIEFVGAEIGPPLQQKVEQALNKHPEANAFIANYDSVLTTGGAAAALRASGRLGEITVIAGEGTPTGNELIYNESGNEACIGTDNEWLGYAALDGLAREFLGESASDVNSGVGNQICDKEHNLPPRGEAYKAPIDYVPAYEELWGLK